jgi:formylglycine-generating enzyme required for sulfatase activity
MRTWTPGTWIAAALFMSTAFPQTAAPPGPAQNSFTYARHYTPGEVFGYEVRVRETTSGSELIGVTEHRVFLRDAIPTERVRWVRLTESVAGDLTPMALEVPVYEMSLHPEGELSLFDLKGDPVMLEMVTDLYAFYFAVSPSVGIANIHQVGESMVRPDLVSNDWADGDPFLVGQSRTEVRLSLVSVGSGEVVYQTDFLPPAVGALAMHRPWMEAPVCNGVPNNLQFVRRQGDGFLAAWGCERSSISSRIDPDSGKLLAALMNNEMTWNVKYCQDRALDQCEERPAITRQRLIDLRLRPPAPEDLSSEKIRVNTKDGLEYVWVPPGEFEMGCVPGDDDCYPEERPAHAVTMSRGFWICRTEVPVQAYEKYTAATGAAMPEEPGSGAMPGYNDGWQKKNHPMVKVTWDEAAGFCSWSGGRLPTEAEGEYAARGGVDGLKYPWGNDRTLDQANFWRTGGDDSWQYTAPVGSFPPNAFGVYDMAGNVYEWVADWFSEDYYAASPPADPEGPRRGRLRVARGGAGFLNPAVLRISTRLRSAPDTRNVSVGIRCAADELP